MTSILTAILALGLGVGLGILVILAGQLLRGYVVFKLWGWFCVPALGLPPIGIAAAIGITLLVSYLTVQEGGYVKETDRKKNLITAFNALLMPFMILLIGYVAHLYL